MQTTSLAADPLAASPGWPESSAASRPNATSARGARRLVPPAATPTTAVAQALAAALAVAASLVPAEAGLGQEPKSEQRAGRTPSVEGTGRRAAPITDAEHLPPGAVAERWVQTSETSAVVYWQTENRARSYVAYGRTGDCPQRTPVSGLSPVTGQPCWTHFHRITGLEPDTRYFYRLVCLGTDGSQRRSEPRALRTEVHADAVRVPGDLPGPPYVLDRANTRYLLTTDLHCPQGAFEISADGVTLDLDGHTVTYNQQPTRGAEAWNVRAYQQNDFGVKVTAKGRVRITGGVLLQGDASSAGTQVGIGCNPVYSRNAAVELAGVEAVWQGADVSGIFLHWGGGSRVHHCVLDDRGAVVTNRHQAISTIDGNAWGDYDHNFVRRTRQQGLRGAVRALRNEIYIDSRATNSFGIVPRASAPEPVEVADNRIFGIGEHPVGIGMFKAYPAGSTVHGNHVVVQCTRRGTEYGYTGSACFRTTWGADRLNVFDNRFVACAGVYDGEPAKARTLWVGLPHFTPKDQDEPIRDARGVFRDNVVAALGPEGAPAGAICVVCLNESPYLIFEGNTVTSTWGNVVLSDSYGHSDGYPKFVGNTFRREGRQADYFTIRQEYAGRPSNGVFLGNRYEHGASPVQIKLQRNGEVVFQRLLRVAVRDAAGKPLGGVRVAIRDAAGKPAADLRTAATTTEAMLAAEAGPSLRVEQPLGEDAREFVEKLTVRPGEAAAVLSAARANAEGRTAAGPYTVRAGKEGFDPAERTADLNETDSVTITLRAAAGRRSTGSTSAGGSGRLRASRPAGSPGP